MRPKPDAELRAHWWRFVVSNTLMLGIPMAVGSAIGSALQGNFDWELIGGFLAGALIVAIGSSPFALDSCTLKLVRGKIAGPGLFWRTIAVPDSRARCCASSGA